MFSNLLSELFGIIVTVVIVDRYLAVWENRKKRAARELFVSSLAKRLDQLALDWAWILNFLATIGTRELLGKLSAWFAKFPALLREGLPDVIRQQLASPPVASPPPAVPLAGPESIDRLLALKLNHLISRLEDALDAVDGGALVMSPPMLDMLVQLRETLLNDLRAITDLRDLLADPTHEQAASVFWSAINATLSCHVYADLVGRLWMAIPPKKQSPKPKSDFLDTLSLQDQPKIVREFLYMLFPQYDPKEIIRRADESGGIPNFLA